MIQEDIPDQWAVDGIVYTLSNKVESVEVVEGAQCDAIWALQKADPEVMAVISNIEQATIRSPSNSEIKKNYVL